MAKYIDRDEALEYITFGVVGKEITCGELVRGIESISTIEVADKDTREFVEKLHPTWDSGYAVGFNDGRRTERRFIEESNGIVHCKDCNYSEINLLDSNEEPQRWCKVGLAKAVNDDDYCSWGERTE